MDLMDAEQVRELIAHGETLEVEFKRGAPTPKIDMIVEACVCLANGRGGTLLLGVEDDGTITGHQPPANTGAHTDPHHLQAAILNKTQEPLATSVHTVVINDHEVIAIEVPRAMTAVGTKSGKYVRRAVKHDGQPECRAMSLPELTSSGLGAFTKDYSAAPARGATTKDLDPQEFERFRRLCDSSTGDQTLAEANDLDILRALQFLIPGTDQLTLGAILAFGTSDALERFLPTAEQLFQEVDDGRLTDNRTLRLPLLRAFEELTQLVDLRNTSQEVLIDYRRVAVPKVPHHTVREAIANALVHRDYSLMGPVRVQLDDDEFRVSSPGGLPEGITVDNMLEHSVPRNPLLADLFKRAGLVDRASRGIREMHLSLLRTGRHGPDYSLSNDSLVTVVVDTSDSDLELVEFVYRQEREQGDRLRLHQLQIIYEVRTTGPQTAGQLAESLALPVASVKKNSRRLVEMGILESRGATRNRSFHLSPAFYRQARADEYIRARDIDPFQQEQMVLDFVRQKGTITRSTAADLCKIQPTQASQLLQRLKRQGKLTMLGARKTARYVLPDPKYAPLEDDPSSSTWGRSSETPESD